MKDIFRKHPIPCIGAIAIALVVLAWLGEVGSFGAGSIESQIEFARGERYYIVPKGEELSLLNRPLTRKGRKFAFQNELIIRDLPSVCIGVFGNREFTGTRFKRIDRDTMRVWAMKKGRVAMIRINSQSRAWTDCPQAEWKQR